MAVRRVLVIYKCLFFALIDKLTHINLIKADKKAKCGRGYHAFAFCYSAHWLATHFAGTGIRCNAIAPGFLVSAQNYNLLFNEDKTPTARSAKILNGTPMNRFVDANELLGATLFLCDDVSASAITGVVLPIDCGFAAYSGV